MSAKTVKAQIKIRLDALVTAGTLAQAIEDNFHGDPLARDVKYPVAILSPPAIESELFDNRTHIRTYTFDILIVQKGENIKGVVGSIEDLAEAIIDDFDNQPTLSGTAEATVVPVTSTPRQVTHGNKELVVFTIQLRAQSKHTLTF